MRVHRLIGYMLGAALLAACGGGSDQQSRAGETVLPPGMLRAPGTNADAVPPPVPYDPATPRVAARAAASRPHDTAAFTQGLVVTGGRLIEGTGREGRSEVREAERATGRVRRRAALPAPLFGEGITVVGERLYQLTWRHGRGYVYDAARLAPLDSFAYTGEGWGLATDGSRLYLSDGTSQIRVIDPAGFRVERTFQVREAGRPVWMLNELEWVRGELWANVYPMDLIARIDPEGGRVLGWIDVGGLLTPAEREGVRARGGVANGVAFDSARGRVFVTGKLWPLIFEIELDGLSALAATSPGDVRAR